MTYVYVLTAICPDTQRYFLLGAFTNKKTALQMMRSQECKEEFGADCYVSIEKQFVDDNKLNIQEVFGEVD